jgi:hypothetical protein
VSAGTADVEEIEYIPANNARLALRVFGFGGATNSYRLRVQTVCP